MLPVLEIALQEAIQSGNSNEVRNLLARGADPNRRLSGENGTALHRSIEHGDISVFHVILDAAQTDINRLARDGCSPLRMALEMERYEMAQALLEKPGIQNEFTPNMLGTLLLKECKRGNYRGVWGLVHLPGIAVDVADDAWRTPLFHAASSGRSDIASALIKYGKADPNKCDISGRSPLYVATCANNTVMVDYLLIQLYQIADTNLGIYGMRTNENSLEQLMHPEIEDTPLHQAAYRGSEEIVKLLLGRNRTDYNLRDREGRTALHCAIDQGHDSITHRLLYKTKIEVNVCDKQGRTPLLLAIERDNLAVLKAILARPHVDVNQQGQKGETALHRAVQLRRMDHLRFLMEVRGIDASIRDETGKTPLELAQRLGFTDAATVLRSMPQGSRTANASTSGQQEPLRAAATAQKTVPVSCIDMRLTRSEEEWLSQIERLRHGGIHTARLQEFVRDYSHHTNHGNAETGAAFNARYRDIVEGDVLDAEHRPRYTQLIRMIRQELSFDTAG